MFKNELKSLLASLLCSKILCQSSVLSLSVNSAVVLKLIFLMDKDLSLSLLLFKFPTCNSILSIVVFELFLILVGKLITLIRLYVLRMLFSSCFSLDSVR